MLVIRYLVQELIETRFTIHLSLHRSTVPRFKHVAFIYLLERLKQ